MLLLRFGDIFLRMKFIAIAFFDSVSPRFFQFLFINNQVLFFDIGQLLDCMIDFDLIPENIKKHFLSLLGYFQIFTFFL